MSKVCISNCINDPRLPARTAYVSLHGWTEPDAEVAKSGSLSGFGRGPTAIDGISCRQLYLRSYKFSKKETMPEKMKKCLTQAREKMVGLEWNREMVKKCLTQAREKMVGLEWNREMVKKYGKRKCDVILRKMREVSFSAFFRVFWRLLSGAAPVDVVEGRR